MTGRPRGTQDILPQDTNAWNRVEDCARTLCAQYGYSEIRTPIFEHTELFVRGVGETSDIVEKEMYTFEDRGRRSVTLRPEGTAPVVRAFLENNLYAGPQPTKVFYLGPMFRYGRPQAGRLRQFHQFGLEVFGSGDPAVDAEVIALAMDFYGRLGINNLELHLNSVGCPECRPAYREKLQRYLQPHLAGLCPTCRGRYEKNPLRILDCKEPPCREAARGAPRVTDTLCRVCAGNLQKVEAYLGSEGIPYLLDPALVRGLDYYTGTAFEIMVPGIGAQSSIGGGGRYDRLVKECGGPATPAVGFGLGIERILLTMADQGLLPPPGGGIDVYVVKAGEGVELAAFQILQSLRRRGVRADQDYLGRSVKMQFRAAARSGARLTVILGEIELARAAVQVKFMETGTQVEAPMAELPDRLMGYLSSGEHPRLPPGFPPPGTER